jgi:Protein of unknown function (DUF3843)
MAESRFRPEGHKGPLDRYLSSVQSATRKALIQAQKGFSHESLILDSPQLRAVAAMLVEFAEDLHCDVGMWRSVERANLEFFGTPLPFVLEPTAALAPDQISPERLQHFLWVLYPQVIRNVNLRPDHPDLILLSQVAAEVLCDEFAGLPDDSSVKRFLQTPDQEGWHVKRKLVWLGTKSYLFRLFCQQYVEQQNHSESQISVLDDFLCQQTTEWAGLGALEVLAGVLHLPPNRRADLLSWSVRHNALYKVLSSGDETIDVLNVINDEKYRVRLSFKDHPFVRGEFFHGSLVRWDGEWCWSGEQRGFGQVDAATVEQFKQHYRKRPTILYRYSPDALAKARELTRKQYDEFVASHGKDWQVYPSALALAAEIQKSTAAKFAALPEHDRERLVRTHGPQVSRGGTVNLPPELLESSKPIGVYFNPNEGMEIFPDFADILSGLKKNGIGLIATEENAICGLVKSHTRSPGFLRRLVEEFGIGSIAAAFLLENQNEDYLLEYLLRRYSGNYYRPRYPTMMLT